MTLPHEVILALSKVQLLDPRNEMGESKERIKAIDLIVAAAKQTHPHLFKEEYNE